MQHPESPDGSGASPVGTAVIETVDQASKTWAEQQAGAGTVVFGPLPAGTQGLQFSLMDILPFPAPRGPLPVPLRFTLRYLVTVNAGSPEEAHVRLGRALLAAMLDPQMEEELGPVPPTLFQALGWPPQPAFYLRVPVVVPRPEKTSPPVREHLIGLRPWPGSRVTATVRGPDGLPLPGVAVSTADTSTVTDDHGRFSLPAFQTPDRVQVTWKGRTESLPISPEGQIILPTPETPSPPDRPS